MQIYKAMIGSNVGPHDGSLDCGDIVFNQRMGFDLVVSDT